MSDWIKEPTATRVCVTKAERDFIARLQDALASLPSSLRIEVTDECGFEIWKETEPCVSVLVAQQRQGDDE